MTRKQFFKKRSEILKQNLKRGACGLFCRLDICKIHAVLPISKLPKFMPSPYNWFLFQAPRGRWFPVQMLFCVCHTQAVVYKIWPVNASSRKTHSQAVKCYAHQLVLRICCLNLHKTQYRASTWGKARKQHKHGFSSYLCGLPKHCSESKPYNANFSRACQNIPLSTAFSLGYSHYSPFSRHRRHLPHPRPLAGQWTTVTCSDLPVTLETAKDLLPGELKKKCTMSSTGNCPSYSLL